MSNFTALETAILNAIKQNGNQEITGNLLQEILLSVVDVLGNTAINDLETGLSNEVTARQNAVSGEATTRQNADTTLQNRIDSEATARQNADSTLQGNINSEATARQNADATLQGNINAEATARLNADTQLNNLITGIKNNIDNGFVYAGIATPSDTPASGKVFYIAIQSGTYTNFGELAVPYGINVLKYNGSTWSQEKVIGIDNTPIEGSKNLLESGGMADEFLRINGQKKNYIDNFKVINTGSFVCDLNYFITKEVPLEAGKTYVWENGAAIGGSTNVTMYARIYTSSNTSRYVSMNIRSSHTYSFTAQEGDVKAVFTFYKGLENQSVSCNGEIIYQKKDDIHGLADEVSDLTSEEYAEEAVPFEWIAGKAIAIDGTEASSADYLISSFIPVKEGEQYRLTSYNNTQSTSTYVYLNYAGYSDDNVESFVPDAFPFYFHGRFEQSIAVVIPKGVKYVRITAMQGGAMSLNEWGCFHIKDYNEIKAMCNVKGLRFIGRSRMTNYITPNTPSITIAGRKFFYFGGSVSNQYDTVPNFAILKVSAGDKFTLNKPVGQSGWYNTKFYDSDLNMIKQYENVAYTDKVIVAPDKSAWLYVSFVDNCYIGAVEENVEQSNNIENEVVKKYLDNVEYDNNDYSYSMVSEYAEAETGYRKDQPHGLKLTWKADSYAVSYLVELTNGVDNYSETLDANATEYTVYSVIPHSVYMCKISAIHSDESRNVVVSRRVNMDGRLRMIMANNLVNIRDIGGWETIDGKRVKYGKIIRGCAVGASSEGSQYVATEADKNILLNLVGIKSEFDMQTNAQSGSPLGETVEYNHIDPPRWDEFQTSTLVYGIRDSLALIRLVITTLQANKPIYMHCLGGADRTGCAVMTIEAVLGMYESDMLKDYELTSFSTYGMRLRNTTGNDAPKTYCLPYIKTNFAGDTLSEKWVNFLKANGLTDEEIATFRSLLLE